MLAVGFCLLVYLAIGATCTGVALGNGPSLVLKADGKVVAAGKPVFGTLRFGPCGTFKFSGKLTANRRPTDSAKFTSTEGGGGGCGEGGPIITGSIDSIKLTAAGRFNVAGQLVYRTTLEPCEYALDALSGGFAIPGPTEATVSGVGKLMGKSGPGCPATTTIEYPEATLDDGATGEPFEAEI